MTNNASRYVSGNAASSAKAKRAWTRPVLSHLPASATRLGIILGGDLKLLGNS